MTRKRRRQRGRRGWPVFVLVVFIGLALAFSLESASVTNADLERSTSIDVVNDTDAAHELYTYTSLQTDDTCKLVNATNKLNVGADVTVELNSNSTSYGDLVVDNTNEGDSATFFLASGANKTVFLQVPNDLTLDGETVYFHVNASADPLDVTAMDRSVPIKNDVLSKCK